MRVEKFKIYLADLNPQMGTEPGKIRPVVVVQSDLLNEVHSSTIICPMTTKIVRAATSLRVFVPKQQSHLDFDSDILVDQIRAIDNRRFIKSIGKLNRSLQDQLVENLKDIILD